LFDSSKLMSAPRWMGISTTPRSQRSAQIIVLHGTPSSSNTPGIRARWLL
jgi:hypothetical protein